MISQKTMWLVLVIIALFVLLAFGTGLLLDAWDAFFSMI